ncbi:hypothetical protein DFH09DRAFT_1221217 [Mycena vulgaris]|nr:hypothetical protein DFH09DRAFT_1221217 [Mycena vulgaris]
MLYTFPQSVGIAGGRPSSSYYFVGVQGDGQGDGLFYLDPHHSRPAEPLRPYVPHSTSTSHAPHTSTHNRTHVPDTRRSLSPEAYAPGGSMSPEHVEAARSRAERALSIPRLRGGRSCAAGVAAHAPGWGGWAADAYRAGTRWRADAERGFARRDPHRG